MINSSWPNTPCQMQRPSLIEDDDDDHTNNKNGIDPLPYVRGILNELSNTEAFLYARQCRVVVAKLRLCWSDVNEEIKSLLKHKEYTAAAIEHIRKDLIINRGLLPQLLLTVGFRLPRTLQNNPITSSNSNLNNTNISTEATLLNENSLLLVGNLLAFTSDVIQVFQDATKLIEESCEIKKQAMNQIKDTKVYSLIVNQSIAQKLADIITLAMNKENFRFYIKVRTALNIQAKDIHEELCFVCGDETPSLKTIEEWSTCFRENREEAEDEVRSDSLVIETTSENIEQVCIVY
ncbi:unnamed protein product [Rotaria sordida]|uniref:Uncharacterized protein n=1 Tax=Rotaria sordida TaxID=392033 RepID=A0A819Y263_9BILA|nr:unnamed protein product [Rotaria sordida]